MIGRHIKLFNFAQHDEVAINTEIMNDKSFSVSIARGQGKVILVNAKEVEKFLADFTELYERIKLEIEP